MVQDTSLGVWLAVAAMHASCFMRVLPAMLLTTRICCDTFRFGFLLLLALPLRSPYSSCRTRVCLCPGKALSGRTVWPKTKVSVQARADGFSATTVLHMCIDPPLKDSPACPLLVLHALHCILQHLTT
jgi:hypothetical protein